MTPIHDDSADGILNHALTLHQPRRGARFNADAILLAAAVAARPHERVLELGMGVGALALALLWRMKKNITVVGVERQANLYRCAQKNIMTNGMARHCFVHHDDIRTFAPASDSPPFDHIVTNPPWRDARHEPPSPLEERRQAFHQTDVPLREWIARTIHFARRRALITMIVGARHGTLVLALFEKKSWRVSTRFLRAHTNAPPQRLIVQAAPHHRDECRQLPALTLHDGSSHYSAAAEAILRTGKALSWHK